MDQVTDILIKGMVCDRCVSVIRKGMEQMGFPVKNISLGKVSLDKPLAQEDIVRVNSFLLDNGFEWMENRHQKMIDQVKKMIADVFAQNVKYDVKLKFSKLLAESLHMNYDSISELFSAAEGITLERYIITKRIEKVKELLVYTDFTLTEIAYITGFSSVNHLSRQFKEFSGLTPTYFKKIKTEKNKLSGSEQM